MTDTVSSTSAGTGSAAESFGELIAGLRQTFATGTTRSVAWRRDQLKGILRLIDENEAELIRAIKDDLGRPAIESYAADLGHVKAETKYILKNVGRWAKPKRARLPLTSLPGKGWIQPEPLGVVLVIAPWNYPVQLLLNPLAAALAAGNCVVAKPSELAPACSAVLARLIPKYLDDSAVVVVEGGVAETTALLEQRYDHIFFTGSTRVGQVVMEAAAKHLTPVTLELGGKSPAIVTADADLDVTAKRLLFGKQLNAGQTCIAPDYVLADVSIRDQLVDKLAETSAQWLGRDAKASADFGRIISKSHFDRLSGLLEGHGGTVACGGETDADQRFVAPTIVVDPDLDSPLMREEIFGPILPVLAVENVDEAIDFVNEREKPLALYVFSCEQGNIDRILERTSSGGACINHTLMHITPQSLPFGGVGQSGMGAYHGKAGFDVFTHHKSVLQKPVKPDPALLYPPYNNLKERLVKMAF